MSESRQLAAIQKSYEKESDLKFRIVIHKCEVVLPPDCMEEKYLVLGVLRSSIGTVFLNDIGDLITFSTTHAP